MAKIQLKKSNVLDGGSAKAPEASQMKFGEIAINYNANSPTIFIKDSNGQIIAIDISKLGTIDSGASPPGIDNNVGDLFFETSSNSLLFWNGTSWVPLNANLSYNPAPTKGTIVNTAGDDADIPLADAVNAGLMSPTDYSKLLAIVGVVLNSPSNGLSLVEGKLQANIATTSAVGTVKVGSGLDVAADGTLSVTISQDFLTTVDLGYIQETDYNEITNSGGTGVRLELATSVVAGLMSPASVQFLNSEANKTYLEEVNLNYSINGNQAATVTNTGGLGFSVPIATSTYAGLFTSDEKQKLAQLQVGQGSDGLEFVNLSYQESSDQGTIINTAGDNAIIPLANTFRAGLMGPGDVSKLDSINTNLFVYKNDPVSLLFNDTNYVSAGANISVFANDANYATPGEGVSQFSNDANYVTLSYAVNNFVTLDDFGIKQIIKYSGLGISDGSSENISLNPDGSAFFAGNITLAGGGGATQALQKQEIESLIIANSSLGAVLLNDGGTRQKIGSGGLGITNGSATEFITLFPNGNANFVGSITANGNSLFNADITLGGKLATDLNTKLLVQSDGIGFTDGSTEYITLLSNGNANFVGGITAYGNSAFNADITLGGKLATDLNTKLAVQSNGVGFTDGSTEYITLFSNGNANFVGGITANGNSSFNADITLAGKLETTLNTKLTVQSNGVGFTDGSTEYITLSPNGNANFVGGITASGNSTFNADITLGGKLETDLNTKLTVQSDGVGFTDGSTEYITLFSNGDSTFLGDMINVGTYNDIRINRGSRNLSTSKNLAIGTATLASQTSDSSSGNIAIGEYALTNLEVAAGNTAIGNSSQSENITGESNVAIGNSALRDSTYGDNNVAIGKGTMMFGTGGAGRCTAIGSQVLQNFTPDLTIEDPVGAEVSTNTGVGFNALNAATTGYANTAMGYKALSQNQTGFHNVAIGDFALEQYTDEGNVAVGFRALDACTTGTQCTAVGKNALAGNATGVRNTGMGTGALRRAEGSNNTALGFNALIYGVGNTTISNNNTCIGAASGANTPYSGCTMLGQDSQAQGNNELILGISGVTSYSYGAVGQRSDARDKTDIRDTLLGLDFIKSLRAVDYRYDYRDDYYDKEEVVEEGETVTRQVSVTKDGSRSGTRFHHGLIAQEVKAAADAQGIDFAGYKDHKVNGGNDVLSIAYGELIAPLIKAVQELSEENAELKARIEALEAN